MARHKDYYLFNSHHHINKENGRTYKNITTDVKIEVLVDIIEMLEFQLLKYKGYDEEVIHLMKLIDDTEEIKIETDDKHKDKLEVCVVRLNQITVMLEELRVGSD
jgi:hypothetical protein